MALSEAHFLSAKLLTVQYLAMPDIVAHVLPLDFSARWPSPR